jgi:hypothetical protein
MDKIHQVCSECKLFTNEDSFGDGWCEFHQKETFCENGACEDGIEITNENTFKNGKEKEDFKQKIGIRRKEKQSST